MVYEFDLTVSDVVLFRSEAPKDAVFFNGGAPGAVAGVALALSGNVNLDEPPKLLPFGVGSFF